MIDSCKKAIKAGLPKNSFARHVSVLASGTAIAQAIPIAISPILTRLYTPDEFGQAALYIACVAVLAVVASARYELAVTLPASDEDAAHIVSFTLKLCMTISILLYLPIYFLSEFAANLIGNAELAPWFYLLPVSVMATCAFNTFQYWCNRSSQYKRMSANRVQNAGLTALANVVFGLVQVKGGMILGSAIGQVAASTLSAGGVWRKDSRIFSRNRFSSEISLARRYSSHPMHIAPAQLIGVVAQQIPVFMFSSLFSLASAGFFSMAYRLVSLPASLIANAIGDVYRQRISVVYHERGEFRDLFIGTLKKTALLAAPPFVLLYFMSPFLFELAFGASWRMAGEYAQILIVASFFQFVFTPVDKGAVVVGATKYIFAWHLIRLLGYILLFVAKINYNMTVHEVLWLFVIFNTLMYVLDGVFGYAFAK